MKKINWKKEYDDGLCPDCSLKIPSNASEGDECENCNHVFWTQESVSNSKCLDPVLSKKGKTMSSRKEQLQKELSKIEAEENSVYESNAQKLLQGVDKELDAFDKLRTFCEKGTVTVELKYEIYDSTFHYYDLFKPDIFENDDGCNVKVKEPKGYNIVQFVSESHFGNLLIESKKDFAAISPKFKEFIQNHDKCLKNLTTKAANIGKKLGFSKEEINDIILAELQSRED